AKDLRYISYEVYMDILELTNEVGKMLNGLINKMV
ncbi:MAG TPA: four helix bundle protein, partial [Clostridiales bacterium]|nr:four helix bundle protein [Clostridiales bacterium]